MNVGNILKLARNDLNQYRMTRKYILSSLSGMLLVLSYLLLIIIFPINTLNDLNYEYLSSIKARYPDVADDLLVRIAATETTIPGLLLLTAVISPGFLALSALTAEKENRTIECLFLLPVSDKEILFAKIMSSIPFAIIGTWLLYVVFVIISAIYHSMTFATYLVNWKFIIELLMLIPLVSILSALGGIIISISVSDTRTALSISFIPGSILISMCFMLAFGIVAFSVGILIIAAIMLCMLNIVVLGIALSCFKREKILLRY